VVLESSPADAGKRLDHFLQERLSQYSRTRLQSWIKEGRVTVGGIRSRASHVLRGQETVQVEPQDLPPLRAVPEDLPVEVLYEDAAVIAVNKPADMVVHAGAGRRMGTLVNALLHRFGKLPEAGGVERPGIVHRLDRGTSGVLLVARTDAAHRNLAAQFASRTVEKVYLALVCGVVKGAAGRIDKAIARDKVRRTRMTVRTATGRHAITEYRVLERFAAHTLLEVRPGTGRTHQIRVHLASIGHPVAGDRLYGAPATSGRHGRFFLHASRISFDSPENGERVKVTAPLPEELQDWVQGLKADSTAV
jgi:23S rRNA pseudouridine1911/1915/1917 synthase